ncbi:small GTP-binding protein [Babesia ovata]|uniref:Small GTP-binding protein n=1 Tax=Babesia ovata TaxID=189622 RepID=A0A2H6K7D7_9APIC|nr:small GTP-binding protein [Babesia ovata]GBE58911.1 small GTP-binding protein [Babesia ovata]
MSTGVSACKHAPSEGSGGAIVRKALLLPSEILVLIYSSTFIARSVACVSIGVPVLSCAVSRARPPELGAQRFRNAYPQSSLFPPTKQRRQLQFYFENRLYWPRLPHRLCVPVSRASAYEVVNGAGALDVVASVGFNIVVAEHDAPAAAGATDSSAAPRDRASQQGRDQASGRGAPSSSYSPDDAPAGQVSVKFDIWDTAGQERFKSIAPIYYRGAACAIVILDVSSSQSLQHATSWVNQLRVANSNETIVVLVANKVDLLGTNEENARTLENARAYAKEQSLLFVETSAKTGQNISAVFEMLAQEILRNPKRFEHPSASKASRALNVNESSSRMIKLNCCDSA